MRRNLLIFLLIGFTLATILFVWFNSQRKKQQVPSLPRFEERQSVKKKEFLDKLPIEAENFRIAYNPVLSSSVIVEIVAKDKAEFLERKSEAAIFIKNFEIEDFCALDVRFIPVEKTVKMAISDSDVFAEGCPVPTPKSSPR